MKIIKTEEGAVLNFGTKEITTKEYEDILAELGASHRLEIRKK